MAINTALSSENPATSLKTKAKRMPRRYTLAEYFRMEEKSLHKHEYHNGYITSMAGASFNHNTLALRAATLLNNFIDSNNINYFVNGSDMKIKIEEYDKAVYPDAVVICEKPQYFDNRKDIIINPLIVVEVLSFSTASYDRTSKFEMYRTVPTLKEYVLIYQSKKEVSVYTKQENNTWILQSYEGEDAIAILYMLHQCPLPLATLYKNLDLNE